MKKATVVTLSVVAGVLVVAEVAQQAGVLVLLECRLGRLRLERRLREGALARGTADYGVARERLAVVVR